MSDDDCEHTSTRIEEDHIDRGADRYWTRTKMCNACDEELAATVEVEYGVVN